MLPIRTVGSQEDQRGRPAELGSECAGHQQVVPRAPGRG